MKLPNFYYPPTVDTLASSLFRPRRAPRCSAGFFCALGEPLGRWAARALAKPQAAARGLANFHFTTAHFVVVVSAIASHNRGYDKLRS